MATQQEQQSRKPNENELGTALLQNHLFVGASSKRKTAARILRNANGGIIIGSWFEGIGAVHVFSERGGGDCRAGCRGRVSILLFRWAL
jgi:hypothetical protein